MTEFIEVIKDWCEKKASTSELIELQKIVNNCFGNDAMKLKAISLMNEYGKLHAVKYVKEATNWSLREAKDYCDNIEPLKPQQ